MKILPSIYTCIIVLVIVSCASPAYILNTGFLNQKESNEMAVMVLNQDNTINQDLSQKIATAYKERKGYNTTAPFFSRQFVTDGMFEKFFNQDKVKLEMLKYLDYLCLGKTTVTYQTSGYDSKMFTADVSIQLHIISAQNGSSVNTISKSTKGIGFSQQQALDVAIQNFLKSME